MDFIPLPGEFGERARAILAGEIAPVPARDAATVVLLRDAAPELGAASVATGGVSSHPGAASATAGVFPEPGVEVYMIRRKASMAFAAGAYVFPGGSVDPRDADHDVAWAGPEPREWAGALGADVVTARGLVCAAVRETFEESGVLLAGPSAGTVVADTTGDDWEADREALIDRRLSMAGFLAKRGLVLRADLLRPWGHWITPEVEFKRFDTRFFAAALPPGQLTRDVGGEADQVEWLRPAQAIERAGKGEINLMPPTYRTLTEMADFADVSAVLASDRKVETFQPHAAEVDGEMRLILPGHDYRMP
ncbi:NUDIX hydrolase [Sphaerisporangium sp. B11E5]|uniref:NUDIX hydrolase n=1 Tax=Sphaerisporangium sp. B11E5 TaxID=3153563 RepID=UPI00325D65A1